MKQRYLCGLQEPMTDTLQAQVCEDSLTVAVEAPFLSLFEGHELQAETPIVFVERADTSNGAAFVILFICVAILIYLHRNSDGLFTSLFKAGFDSNLANQNARVENSQRQRNLQILQFVAIVSISLFLSKVLMIWTSSSQLLSTQTFQVAAVILSILIINRVLLWFLSVLFDLSGEYKFHRFNLNMFAMLSGLLLLPISLLLFYSPQIPFELVAYCGLGILGFFYLKGLQRGLSIALSSSSISVLHLFYYLCALEILPVFVLIRILQNM